MIYESSQWFKDIDRVTEVVPEIERLAGSSVMITGATGLICSAVVDILIRYNETHEEKIGIIAAGRQAGKVKKRFGIYAERDYFKYMPYDAASDNNSFTEHADYIIHGASNAYPGLIMKEPVETMLSNFTGTYKLLQYALSQKTKRLLYVSSSEVYGKKDNNKAFSENEYGFIDILNARNSYSVGKRAAETLLASFSAEYGTETLIVRPGHIYGPTAGESDNRVSSAWAYMAARGEEIVMKSDGSQIRSYCHCLDCASAILKVLLLGENTHAYNISNPDSVITIRRLAELLSKAAGSGLRLELPTEEEKKAFNPMSNSSLDSESLMGLGWKGCFDAEEGLAHTVSILKEII